MVQVSHLYLATGKIIALTIQTFVGKVGSLLFNTLPASKRMTASGGQDRIVRISAHHLPSLTVK